MRNLLIVVDMQKDFVDGALGTAEAQAIVPAVAERIRGWDGDIIVTMDTHGEDYMDTQEGKNLPVPHCIRGTDGWKLNAVIAEALEGKDASFIEKGTFGSRDLPETAAALTGGEAFSATFVGLCTDICVVSNALLLKAFFPEMSMKVEAALCAGVTPAKHEAALETLRSCQFAVV